jgi:diguanylate cyclase (GGDEF)-like protein/PAS domain S-box-containing protein
MLKNFSDKPIFVLVLTALLIAFIGGLVDRLLPVVHWEAVSFHLVIEALGALAALMMAAFLLMIRQDRNNQDHYIWIAAGLIGMGLLHGFHAWAVGGLIHTGLLGDGHAAILPGHGCVWLQCTATLVGGVLFALVWLPEHAARSRWAWIILWSAAVAATVFGVVTVAFPSILPMMIIAGEFITAARSFNFIGVGLFLAAMVRFSLRYQTHKSGDDLIFAVLCLFFGLATLLFSMSGIWSSNWWLWHFIRLGIVLIALGYVLLLFRQTRAALFNRNRELRFKNRILEIFVTRSHDRIFPEVLKVILEAAASRYGIFGYLNHEGALVVPAMTREVWDRCRISKKAHVFPRKTWNDSSWPRAVREKRTVYANGPVCRVPAGHIAIIRHMSLPIIFQDKVIGIFQVANKKSDYTAADIRMLEQLTGYVAPLLNARQEKMQAQDMVANVLDAVDAGFIIVNRNFEIISANPAFAESVGRPLGEIVGRHCYKITHQIDQPCYMHGCDCAVKHVFDFENPHHSTLHTHHSAQGDPVYVETRAFALTRNDLGEVETAAEIAVDVTEKKQREADIHNLAFFDPLTSLPNRRLLRDRLEQAFVSGERSGHYGAVLFLDLDHFKTLNDTRGHDVGDQLLIETAGRLRALMRGDDTVSRQGGDEFVVVLKDLGEDEKTAVTRSWHVAEKIRSFLDQPVNLGGHQHFLTASIGISLFCGHDTPVEELFKRADTAMYEAKEAGRNTVRFFDPAMQVALEAASTLETDLRNAIEQGQFVLHYQPQVEGDGRIIGAEALLRWAHPDRGMVPPGDFIPLAEKTGLILPIGHWVLEEACSRLAAWAHIPGADNLGLAVNISAYQFRQPDFVKDVQQVIAATGADPARLKLELTESLVLVDVAGAKAKMAELKTLGIGFSMDDFGTGYSSLSQLKHLPLEQLKIDRSFIKDLGTSPQEGAIVKTIIAMGSTLGLHVIAEGVENQTQLNFLIQAGCRACQGYLFSRPVPEAAFQDLLAAGGIIGVQANAADKQAAKTGVKETHQEKDHA